MNLTAPRPFESSRPASRQSLRIEEQISVPDFWNYSEVPQGVVQRPCPAFHPNYATFICVKRSVPAATWRLRD